MIVQNVHLPVSSTELLLLRVEQNVFIATVKVLQN